MAVGRIPTMAAMGLALVLALGVATGARATTIVFYDSALGGLPSDQGMVFGGFPAGLVVPNVIDGVTNLNSTGLNLSQAGFGTISPLALDNTFGYALEFSAEVVAESHSGNPVRAGFSVLMVGANPTSSIEIGFQEGRLFAQNDAPLFGNPPADENAGFNPVGMGFVDYSLAVLGSSYTLWADSAAVLGGSLRDYTAFGLPPYTLPNTIFLGDNTSSAQADVNISRVALVAPVAAVPEPGTQLLLALGLAGIGFYSRRATSVR